MRVAISLFALDFSTQLERNRVALSPHWDVSLYVSLQASNTKSLFVKSKRSTTININGITWLYAPGLSTSTSPHSPTLSPASPLWSPPSSSSFQPHFPSLSRFLLLFFDPILCATTSFSFFSMRCATRAE